MSRAEIVAWIALAGVVLTWLVILGRTIRARRGRADLKAKLRVIEAELLERLRSQQGEAS